MSRFVAIISAALTLAGASALAQVSPPAGPAGAPSTEAIIKSLTPTAGAADTTRGIRMVRPGATTASRAPASAGAAAPAVSLMVLFATNSADLAPEAVQVVDQLGRALTSPQLAKYKFRVEGHTDTVGTPAFNLALSKRRAETVVSYLEQRFGIPGSRLQAMGMGEQGLLVQTPNETAEPRNRRVQVVNLGS